MSKLGDRCPYFEVDGTPCIVSYYLGGGVKIKIVATGCHILRLQFTDFDFGWGSALDPAEGACRAPQTCKWILGYIRLMVEKGEKGDRKGTWMALNLASIRSPPTFLVDLYAPGHSCI